MTDPIRSIEIETQLLVRDAPDGSGELEARIVPFGVPAVVRDLDPRTMRPVGAAYREVIVGMEDFRPEEIVLEAGGHRGAIAGRGYDGRVEADGAHVAFRLLDTSAGRDLRVLAREGIARAVSIEIDPRSPSRRTADGTVERTAIVRRVAVVDRGAYQGAEITAVRQAAEEQEGGIMPEIQEPTGTPAAVAPAAPAPEPAASGEPTIAARSAAERDAIASIRTPARVSRQELVYGPGGRSFLRDLIRAREDSAAAEAQARHYRQLEEIQEALMQGRSDFAYRELVLGRAGDTLSSELGGAYPNAYLPGLLTSRIMKGRPMGSFFDRVTISDARPQIFPKVTTSTSTAAQASEAANPAASDFGTTAVTVNPLLYGSETLVSRQVLDGASPAAEGMLLEDMLEGYAQASEAVIVTAVEAGATASGTAITAATPYAGVIGNVVAYFSNRYKPAQAVFAPSAAFATLLAQTDSDGRPIVPWVGATNASGTVLDGGAGGILMGADLKLSWSSTANTWGFARSNDHVIFESAIARFTYEQPNGPSAVRFGLWAYLGIGTRLGMYKKLAV